MFCQFAVFTPPKRLLLQDNCTSFVIRRCSVEEVAGVYTTSCIRIAGVLERDVRSRAHVKKCNVCICIVTVAGYHNSIDDVRYRIRKKGRNLT